jgi:hypothetical protein
MCTRHERVANKCTVEAGCALHVVARTPQPHLFAWRHQAVLVCMTMLLYVQRTACGINNGVYVTCNLQRRTVVDALGCSTHWSVQHCHCKGTVELHRDVGPHCFTLHQGLSCMMPTLVCSQSLLAQQGSPCTCYKQEEPARPCSGPPCS